MIPERLADALMQREQDVITRASTTSTHFSDALMTDQEILELPKVWVVGGDGGMGDIGTRTLEGRAPEPANVKAVMLDTQVYSNTGGQNSDSTPMLGGNDMNMFGAATRERTSRRRPSPRRSSPAWLAVRRAGLDCQCPKLYRAILDGLEYRGTAFLQCFTPCQPEHGVADDMALTRRSACATRAARRSSSSIPASARPTRSARHQGQSVDRHGLVRDQVQGHQRAISIHGAHWCATEARFRNHLKKIKKDDRAEANPAREHAGAHHAAGRGLPALPGVESPFIVPDFGVYIRVQGANGEGRVPGALASARALLRRAPQGMADAAEQGRHREPRIQGAAIAAGRCGRRQDLEEDFFAHADLLLKERIPAAACHKPAEPRGPVPSTAAGCRPQPRRRRRRRQQQRRTEVHEQLTTDDGRFSD